MQKTISMINNLDDKELVCFLASRNLKYLFKLYKQHGLNQRIKNYIRVLDEKIFIDCYDLDLYAYLRVFKTSDCITYYTNEGMLNKKNMPYLPYVIYYLGISTNILEYNIDQYAYYYDGTGLFNNYEEHDPKNKLMWLNNIDRKVYCELIMR